MGTSRQYEPLAADKRSSQEYLSGQIEALRFENRTIHSINAQMTDERLAFERRIWFVVGGLVLVVLALAGGLLWTLSGKGWAQ